MWLILLVLALALAPPAFAQLGGPLCQTAIINAQGSSGADITITSAAGGVTILAARTDRCSAMVLNSGAQAVRCAPSTGGGTLVVTTTVGFYLPSGAAMTMGASARTAWKCISATGVSGAVTLFEEVP